MTYKQRVRAMMEADGLDLGVADALRRLRAGASDAGWKRLLDRTVEWNKRRQAARHDQPSAPPGEAGRAS